MDKWRSAIESTLHAYPWLPELLGILPLSALFDFIDTDRKLHIFQLVGAVPLWSWPITPAASRILLAADADEDKLRPCHLDRFGDTVQWMALDGRWGDNYYCLNAETLRLCLRASSESVHVPNKHDNVVKPKEENNRIQHLEVICVSSPDSSNSAASSPSTESWLSHHLANPWKRSTFRYAIVAATGWAAWLICIIWAVLLGCYVGLFFLLVVSATGLVIFLLHGNQPRGLLRDSKKGHDRIVVVAEHANSSNWRVFCGQSTVINSLLNLPLKAPDSPVMHRQVRWGLHMSLRALIVMQWATILAAASLKDWNAFFVCVWVAFCIVSHVFLIPPTAGARVWMRSDARIEFKRYHTELSSRRALLSTLVALNPDTIPWADEKLGSGHQPHDGAMAWIDPILKDSRSRRRWQEASVKALMQTAQNFTMADRADDQLQEDIQNSPDITWQHGYEEKEDYWKPFICEGVYMAAKFKLESGLGQHAGAKKARQ